MKIPKIIHYVWLGDKEKPKLFYKCLESWKKFCPDYQIIEWNESNFDFSNCKFAVDAYKAKKFGYVADFIRVNVLNDCGGIYLDTDVEIVKSFDDLLDNDFFLSFENEVYVETATLGSIKKHPFLQRMINYYQKREFYINGKPDLTPHTPIFAIVLQKYYNLKLKASSQLLTDVENRDAPKVMVYNYDYFSPINYTTKKIKTTPHTYSIHYFDASWFTGKLKVREKFLRFVYYLVGKNIFASFTRTYVKSVKKKIKKYI